MSSIISVQEIVTKQNGVEDLLKDVKAVQEAIEIEFNCNDQNDEDFILDDYVSDEEQSDEEHELNVETDVKDNITKVYRNLYLIFSHIICINHPP